MYFIFFVLQVFNKRRGEASGGCFRQRFKQSEEVSHWETWRSNDASNETPAQMPTDAKLDLSKRVSGAQDRVEGVENGRNGSRQKQGLFRS